MTVRHHSVTGRQVRALAENTATAADLAPLLAGQVSKCLSMLALIVRDAEDSRRPGAGAATAAWQLLAEVRRKAPADLAEVLRYPSVGDWASRLAIGGGPGQLALIAATAAIRGNIPFAIPLPASALDRESIYLPSLGTVTLPREVLPRDPGPGDDVAVIRHDGGVTAVSGQRGRIVLPNRLEGDGPGWRALAAVPGAPPTVSGVTGGRLVIDDAYPYRFPADIRVAGRLSPELRQAWHRRAAAGLRVLSADHGRTAAEVALIMRAVVPLATREESMRSVTSRYAFGGVAMSLPTDDVTMALTLAHEVQHAKLAALMDLVPLVSQAAAGRYYVPWRPDPRPLAAVLQGLYAHLEVARFWRQRRATGHAAATTWHAAVEFAKWRNSCALVAGTVRGNPELTGCGTTFLEGMIEVLQKWRHDRIPAAAMAEAAREIDENKRKWDNRNRGG